jgi:hypothetical protein
VAHVRIPRYPGGPDGCEGGVVVAGGGVAVVVDGADAAVDDHGAEGSGWKAGRCLVPETFGLESWACPSARAYRPWANRQVGVSLSPEVDLLTY